MRKGEKLHEDIAQAHPYAFNMGSSRIIPLQDYKKAAEILMERNMPEVLHSQQDKVVFIPEAHLPKEPKVVDVPKFVSTKRKWIEMAEIEGPVVLDQLGMNPGPQKIRQANKKKRQINKKKRQVSLKRYNTQRVTWLKKSCTRSSKFFTKKSLTRRSWCTMGLR